MYALVKGKGKRNFLGSELNNVNLPRLFKDVPEDPKCAEIWNDVVLPTLVPFVCPLKFMKDKSGKPVQMKTCKMFEVCVFGA